MREQPDWPIAHAAQTHPDDVAVVEGEACYTFRDYDAAITRLAASLDVAPGERVGICAVPSYVYLVLLQAVMRRGGVAVPISTRQPDGALTSLAATLGLRHCFTVLPSIPAPLPEAAGSPHAPGPREVAAPAVVVLSSGSSATPKAVVHSYDSLACNALGAASVIPLQRHDRWLLALPLYHVSGLGILFRTALTGATVVIDSGRSLADAIRHYNITHVSVVAAQLRELVAACENDAPLPSLKAVLAGGSHIPPTLVSRAVALGLPLHLSYGSTEMGSQITTAGCDDLRRRPDSSGRLLPYREAKVSDTGELFVRGRTLCLGYLVDGAISPCVDAKGWFHTGDSGAFDGEGYLTVTGRRDRLFISGGENIYPEEIEAALLAMPGIEEAVVVAVPHTEYGARPVAFVRVEAGVDVETDIIRAALTGRLESFKRPDQILAWPADYPAGGIKADCPFLRRRALQLLKQAGE
ncbi:MAG: o-succinylbenzoate--CoA ligase [Verrucomicrobia bacterium]|nr:o-succinylbenzoate--CoA ligase [Verrucomicrobiota bacterium]MBT7066883.1 o-succinylbenzoate--CoA ligase [Verrucomicrobiota bacterium]MBT7699829.1 o-succinylbenzoate--CoA ligase [Verrucomicrobiota bacterium]